MALITPFSMTYRGRNVTNPYNSFTTPQKEIFTLPSAFEGAVKKPPLIFVHGAGAVGNFEVQEGPARQLIVDLAQDFTVMMAYNGGDLWGNDEHVGFIEESRTYLASIGCPGPVTLVGASMGNTGTTNYLRTYGASNVRAIIGMIPVMNQFDLYYRAGYSSSIQPAYPSGGGLDAATLHMHNPIEFASGLNHSVPLCMLYSRGDTTCLPQYNHEFVNNYVGSTVASDSIPNGQSGNIWWRDVGPNGHDTAGQSITDCLPYMNKFARYLTL